MHLIMLRKFFVAKTNFGLVTIDNTNPTISVADVSISCLDNAADANGQPTANSTNAMAGDKVRMVVTAKNTQKRNCCRRCCRPCKYYCYHFWW